MIILYSDNARKVLLPFRILRPFLLILFFQLIFYSLLAQPVTKSLAKKIALNFYNSQFSGLKSISIDDIDFQKVYYSNSLKAENQLNNVPLFYLFKTKDSGFILTSANRKLPPILAYSFDVRGGNKEFPPAFIKMMEKGAVNFSSEEYDSKNIDSNNHSWDDLIGGHFQLKNTTGIIDPLVKTQWGQGWPFNKFCPEDASGNNGHTLAGCNAVAIAQVLNYWGFPEKPHGSISYESGIYGQQNVNFDEINYNFSTMESNDDAIAELIYHSAVATKSQFGANNTVAFVDSIWNALVPNFNYSPNAFSYYCLNYGWQEKALKDINTELEASRPVLYSAWPAEQDQSGHTFIIDGKDENELYHINWGWEGNYDGYFSILLLNPGTSLFDGDQPSFILEIEPGNNIYENTVWNGTVSLDKSVMVMDGTTLSIEKGTTIKSSKNCFIRVDGTLKALGEQNDSIRFTSENVNEGWYGLTFRKTKLNINDSSVLNYCIVENGLLQESELGKRFLENTVTAISIVLRKNVFIENSVIQNNIGFEFGAITLYGYGNIAKRDLTKAIIKNSIIRNNMPSSVWGGGICNIGCEIEIFNSSILNNTINNYNPGSSGVGAGISIDQGNAFLENCIISGNSIKHENIYPSLGGGIYAEGSNISINNCLIENNSAFRGGGIFIKQGSNTDIINSTITKNHATENPEIIYDAFDMPHRFNILNSIISNNNIGNGIFPFKIMSQTNLVIENAFLDEGIESIDSSEDCSITSDNILSGLPGFKDPVNKNFQLNDEAVTVNAGSVFHLDPPFSDLKDIMGNQRVFGGKIDLGAYENQFAETPPNINLEKNILEIVLNESSYDSLKISVENTEWTDVRLEDVPDFAIISIDTILHKIYINLDTNSVIQDSFAFIVASTLKSLPIQVIIDSRPVLHGELSGEIPEDDYIVTADISIAQGKTLVIAPNTKLSFKNNSAIKCEGYLKAINDNDSYIEFKGFKNNAWRGVSFLNLTNYSDSSLLIGCVFKNIEIDYALQKGSIDITYYANLRIDNCEIFENSSYNGAINIGYGSDIIINENYIHNNTGQIGSGITVGNSEALISYNKVMYNESLFSSEPNGGIAIKQINCAFIAKDPFIIGNEIAFNEGTNGGGISISTFEVESHPFIVNNLIYNNKASLGGGIYIDSYYNNMLFPTLINNTIVYNQSQYAAIFADAAAPLKIYNTIFYGNKNESGEVSNIMVSRNGPTRELFYPELRNCLVEGGESSFYIEGHLNSGIYPESVYDSCLHSNPEFVDALNYDFNLSMQSPLINCGTTNISNFTFPEFDFIKSERIVGANIDIGCFEYNGANPTLTITPINQDVSPESGSTTFEISSNTSWTVSDDADWVTLSSASGSGDSTITVTYTENTVTTKRTATMTITGSGVDPNTVTITQAGVAPTLSITPSNKDVSVESGTTDFEILSNIDWTISDNADWVTLSQASGSGNSTITATYTENTLTTSRIATITITGSGMDPNTVTVVQAGVDENRSPTNISLSNSNINENTSIGTEVGRLFSTDDDVGDTHTYTFVSGDGDTDNDSFTISGETLNSGVVFDYETDSSYLIRVQTDDGNGGTFSKSFTISIIDLNEFVGIDDYINEQIKVYPNPVKDKLIVNLEDVEHRVKSIYLYNSEGRMMYSKKDIMPFETVEIPVYDYRSGLYYLNIITEDGLIKRKVMVIR